MKIKIQKEDKWSTLPRSEKKYKETKEYKALQIK